MPHPFDLYTPSTHFIPVPVALELELHSAVLRLKNRAAYLLILASSRIQRVSNEPHYQILPQNKDYRMLGGGFADLAIVIPRQLLGRGSVWVNRGRGFGEAAVDGFYSFVGALLVDLSYNTAKVVSLLLRSILEPLVRVAAKAYLHSMKAILNKSVKVTAKTTQITSKQRIAGGSSTNKNLRQKTHQFLLNACPVVTLNIRFAGFGLFDANNPDGVNASQIVDQNPMPHFVYHFILPIVRGSPWLQISWFSILEVPEAEDGAATVMESPELLRFTYMKWNGIGRVGILLFSVYRALSPATGSNGAEPPLCGVHRRCVPTSYRSPLLGRIYVPRFTDGRDQLPGAFHREFNLGPAFSFAGGARGFIQEILNARLMTGEPWFEEFFPQPDDRGWILEGGLRLRLAGGLYQTKTVEGRSGVRRCWGNGTQPVDSEQRTEFRRWSPMQVWRNDSRWNGIAAHVSPSRKFLTPVWPPRNGARYESENAGTAVWRSVAHQEIRSDDGCRSEA
ncbi:hypothetical protein B0H13DRAFT_1899370 [Mycena leptocephala]|nr:hypothetical protein B0H13DRAFT_1899370 [Mycena leptocephala]